MASNKIEITEGIIKYVFKRSDKCIHLLPTTNDDGSGIMCTAYNDVAKHVATLNLNANDKVNIIGALRYIEIYDPHSQTYNRDYDVVINSIEKIDSSSSKICIMRRKM